MKYTKTIGLLLYLHFKTFFSRENCIIQIEVQYFTKKKEIENVRHYALEAQHLIDKGCRKESAATINLKSNEFFAQGLAKKLKGFAHNW